MFTAIRASQGIGPYHIKKPFVGSGGFKSTLFTPRGVSEGFACEV